MLAQDRISRPPEIDAALRDRPLLLGEAFGEIAGVTPGSLASLTRQPISGRQFGAFPFDRDQPGYLCATMPAARPALPLAQGTRGIGLQRLPARAQYGREVARVAALVSDPGNPLHKVVLARSLIFETDTPIDPMQVALLLSDDPNVLCYCLPLAGGMGDTRWLVGATPERLLKKTGADVLSTPLAGSARRLPDSGADAEAGAALLRSDKDKIEHRIVVEYIHDILAPHCRNLDTPARPELMRTRSMWHLGTRISGVLRDADTPCLGLLHALHPTPAVAGAPLEPALAEIRRAEPFDRDFYAGTIGWVDDRNNGDWHVTLRCAIIEGRRAQLFAGAGIVDDSVPQQEIAETAAKFLAMRQALGISGIM